MNKKTLIISCTLIILTLISSYSFYAYQNSKKTSDERVNQIFKMRDLYNDPIKNLKTDFVIINFWASWCPPCVEETPSLVRFTEKNAKYFTLLALSQDTTKKEIEDFVKTFPALKSTFITIIHDDSQSVAHAYKVEKLPETFIYSVKQNKYLQVSGSTNWDQPEVMQTINRYFNVSL